MTVMTQIDDKGTIEATIRKIEQLKREGPDKFDSIMFSYMKRVYMQTLNEMNNMGIRDTGALMASTRLEREGIKGKYDTAKQETQSQWKILSGGGGIYNIKNKREVDYAKAVHDGHATPTGGWVPARPYLDMAWGKMESRWKPELSKYLQWIQSEWSKDQPTVTSGQWSIPLVSPE